MAPVKAKNTGGTLSASPLRKLTNPSWDAVIAPELTALTSVRKPVAAVTTAVMADALRLLLVAMFPVGGRGMYVRGFPPRQYTPVCHETTEQALCTSVVPPVAVPAPVIATMEGRKPFPGRNRPACACVYRTAVSLSEANLVL